MDSTASERVPELHDPHMVEICNLCVAIEKGFPFAAAEYRRDRENLREDKHPDFRHAFLETGELCRQYRRMVSRLGIMVATHLDGVYPKLRLMSEAVGPWEDMESFRGDDLNRELRTVFELACKQRKKCLLDLSVKARFLIQAFYELGAFDLSSRKMPDEVADKASRERRTAYEHAFRELKVLGLYVAKEGRNGGAWLTELGRRVAENCRDSS